MVKQSAYSFHLPQELIAQYPVRPRDRSRLMVVIRKTKEIRHHDNFRAILEYFGPGDVFIFNDSLVFPAKLLGHKERNSSVVEVLLLRELNAEQMLWDAMVEPARKIRVGNKLYFGTADELVAEVVDNTTARGRTLRFLLDGSPQDLEALIDKYGMMPLPSYITRPPEPEDRERYQCIYAAKKGSVSANSAGFHFSHALFKLMELQDIDKVFVTLHAGMASFRKVQVEDLSKHRMDADYFEISEATAQRVNKAKEERKKICVVGATTFRAVESSVSAFGYLKPAQRWTELFIFYPYMVRIPTAYITGFHLPRSIEMFAAAAFAGFDLLMKAYEEAIKKEYRFGCFGDAMLIL